MTAFRGIKRKIIQAIPCVKRSKIILKNDLIRFDLMVLNSLRSSAKSRNLVLEKAVEMWLI